MPAIEHTLPMEPERTEVQEAPPVGASDLRPNAEYLAAMRELLAAWDRFVRREITQDEYCAVCKRAGALERALEEHFQRKERETKKA